MCSMNPKTSMRSSSTPEPQDRVSVQPFEHVGPVGLAVGALGVQQAEREPVAVLAGQQHHEVADRQLDVEEALRRVGHDVVNGWPQCLQTRAAASTVSAQSGQTFVGLDPVGSPIAVSNSGEAPINSPEIAVRAAPIPVM